MVTIDGVGEVLFGRTRQAVLGLFYGRPTEEFHLRQVARLTGSGLGAVQRELRALVRAGVLLREKRGMHVMYRVNRASPVFEEMRGLVLKTVGVAGRIRKALEPIADRVAWAGVFGSVARGEEGAASDVDLLVVSDEVTVRKLVGLLKDVEGQVGREINPVVYGREEFRRKRRDNHPFLSRVLAGEVVTVAGSVDELG
jgi:predicted nucleotidyltransferase